MKVRTFVSVALLSTAVFLAAGTSHAQVLYVDGNATGLTHDGSSWCAAFLTLDAALAAASSGTTLRVADGTYTPDTSGLSNPREATFRLVDGVNVEGGWAGCGAANPDERDTSVYETVLSGDLSGDDANLTDMTSCTGAGGTWFATASLCSAVDGNGENSYHVVTYDTDYATVVLDGLTVSGGNANGTHAAGPGTPAFSNQGAAVHIHDGDPQVESRLTLRDCVFRDNRGADHGAVNDHGTQASSTTILDSTFEDNYVDTRGAALYIHSGSPTVTGNDFIGNATAGKGAAVYNNAGSTPTVNSCWFEGNEAAGGGGGIWNEDNAATITDSVFFGNNGRSVGGGGVYNNSAETTILRSLFTENVAGGGGAVYNLGSGGRIDSSEFTDNTATVNYGGGIYNNQSSPTIFDCTFTGNYGILAAGAVYAGGFSMPVVANSRFVGNSAAVFGGGAFSTDGGGSHVFVNSVFRNNTGAAMTIYNATAEIVNCTFLDNVGGGVKHPNPQGMTTVTNSIFWNNVPEIQDPHGLVDATYNLVQGGWPGTGNISSAPGFLDEPEVLHLAAGSPAVDAGDNDALVRGACSTGSDCVEGLESCVAGSCVIDADAVRCARRVDDPATAPDSGNAGSLGAPVADMGAIELRNVAVVPPRPEDSLGVTCSVDTDCTNEAECVQGICYVPKNRYLSFRSGTPSAKVAFQVTLVESTDFPEAVGLTKWVGAPDASGVARLECTASPVSKDDWPSTIHVADRDVVPGATYEVRAILDGKDPADSCNFTAPLRLSTVSLWGDCVGPKVGGVWGPPDGVVDDNDIDASVDGFKGLIAVPQLFWLDVDPQLPDQDVDFGDIGTIVNASGGGGYPWGAPSSCP